MCFSIDFLLFAIVDIFLIVSMRFGGSFTSQCRALQNRSVPKNLCQQIGKPPSKSNWWGKKKIALWVHLSPSILLFLFIIIVHHLPHSLSIFLVQIPEKRVPTFQGMGRTLGSSSTSTEPTEATTTTLTTAPAPAMGLVVVDTLPSTSIQLRLADGTRMVSRFNYHHTVRDIRAFIDASRPGGARTYQLQTVGFPPKQLTDLDQSIEQAGLANSVVIQKL